jgi:protein fantom
VDRETYSEEIERLRMQVDPSTLSLADIQKKIHDLDPSMFRQVMKDLHYDGEEPVWAKYDFMERFKIGGGLSGSALDENDPNQLKKEIERLKVERRDLASELEKTQNLLRMQVGIDKESIHIAE